MQIFCLGAAESQQCEACVSSVLQDVRHMLSYDKISCDCFFKGINIIDSTCLIYPTEFTAATIPK